MALLAAVLLAAAVPARAVDIGRSGLGLLLHRFPAASALTTQAITFGAIAGRSFGSAPFTVAATASSGLDVTFASLTPAVCTVAIVTVTIVATGTCTVRASQAGNATYAAAAGVNQGFGVAKATQAIIFPAPASVVLGSAPLMLNATSSSGLVVTLATSTPAVCTVYAGGVSLVSAGMCTLVASQAGSAVYNAAPTLSRSFSVTASAQTISFPVIRDQVVGAAPLALAATASSGLPVAFDSLTPAVCAVTGTSTTMNAAGSCMIRASQGGSSNFSAAAEVMRTFDAINAVQFAAHVDYATGPFSFDVAAGDFNGDGIPDAAVANEGSNTISIFLGSGDGKLVAGSTLATGGLPYNIVVADFNRDGKQDLAVTNIASATVTVYLGNGNGTFGAPITVAVAPSPFGLAVADLNHDGNADLVVTNGSSGQLTGRTIQVLLGNGDGTFNVNATYGLGTSPMGVAIADFDGDGSLDVAATSQMSSTLSILRGNGGGTLAAPLSYPTMYGPAAVSAADLNGDGKMDLVVVGPQMSQVSIYLGHGDGTFAAPVTANAGQSPTRVAIGDFNGDGKQDLALSNAFDNVVSVLLGYGDGTFHAPATFSVGVYPAGIAAIDLNGDGKVDLVVANHGSNTVSVLLNSGTLPSVATLAIQSGTPQTAGVNATFAVPLSVSARDTSNNPVAGAVVTFAAPTTGASGSFGTGGNDAQVTTGATGIATAPPFTANGVPGGYSVAARAGAGSALFALSNTAAALQSPAFTSAAPANGLVNSAYRYGLTASGTPAPMFGVLAAALPPGLILDNASGLISGTPTLTGTFAGTLTATNGVAPDATQSFAITISGTAQTIVFASLPDRVAGVAPFALSASATSGLPVAFVTSTPSICTVTGTIVTVLNGGTCIIQASQSGNATYAPAPTVTRGFSVAALSAQFISFADLVAAPLPSSPVTLVASASSGLPVTFSSLTATVCAIVGNVATLLAKGTCTVRASQIGDGTYAAAFPVERSFSVTASLQTLFFGEIGDRSLTAPPWQMAASASSGRSVAFSSLTSDVCNVSADMVINRTMGICTVRATQRGNDAYDPVSVDHSFLVGQAMHGITFWPLPARLLVPAPFVVGAAASSGLPVTFISLTPAVCVANGNAISLVYVGTCTLRATQSGNATFVAAQADQSFKVYGRPEDQPYTDPVSPPPFVEYATYLGGYGNDKAFDIAVATDGSAYVAGSVASASFPGLASATYTNGGLDLLYVAKMNPQGRGADFATVVGGRAANITNTGASALAGNEVITAGTLVEAMAGDAAGNIFVAAYANSTDFPVQGGNYVRNGAKTIFKSGADGVPHGVGGAIDAAVSTIRAIAIDQAGAVYFTGVAKPGLITTPGAFIGAIPANTVTAPYLIKLSGGGATVFATYLSSPGSRAGTRTVQSTVDAVTTAYAIAVDASGNTYLAGQATADDFPVVPDSADIDTDDWQYRDAFVAKINAAGSAPLFVARLGGTDADRATAIALPPDGSVVIGGKTASLGAFGTPGAFRIRVTYPQPIYAIDRETGFVAKLAADGTNWQWSAPIGAAQGNMVGQESLFDPAPCCDPVPIKVAVDAAGFVYVAGTVGSALVPIVGNLGGVAASGAFLMKITGDGSRLISSTALGAGVSTGLGLDGFGNAYVAGYALPGLAVANAGQATPSRNSAFSNTFVAKVNDSSAPMSLAADVLSPVVGQTFNLNATLADSRSTGRFDFLDGTSIVGSANVAAGVATRSVTFSAGVHRVRAVFHGTGPFDGSGVPEIVVVVDQNPVAP